MLGLLAAEKVMIRSQEEKVMLALRNPPEITPASSARYKFQVPFTPRPVKIEANVAVPKGAGTP